MSKENAVRRAQVYRFLADAFLYPHDNWTEDGDLVARIVRALGWIDVRPALPAASLAELQADYRRAFGAAGSLGYETEYGLPHEYRQSQEMADIAGFYRAFGFQPGSRRRERPDHIAVELEFMYALALKEAYALETGAGEHLEVCVAAQVAFLQDHLGRWINLFAQSLALQAAGTMHAAAARFAADFVQADAGRLGVSLEQTSLESIRHTPFDPDFSCADCAAAGLGEQGLIRPPAAC